MTSWIEDDKWRHSLTYFTRPQKQSKSLLTAFINNPFFHAVFLFSLSFTMRMIPEFMVGKYPIGSDTLTFYAPYVAKFGFDLLNMFFWGHLTSWLMMKVTYALVGNCFLALKIVGSTLYGLLWVAFYVFLSSIGWRRSKCALASIFVLVQVPALRLSWDLFHNMMGLIFMFLAFAELSKIISSRDPQKKHYAGFAVFSILTALSHQLTFFIVSIITLFVVVRGYFKKEPRLPGKYLIGSLFPSLVIFAVIVFLPRFASFPEVNPFQILYKESLMEQSATNFFVNYIGFISYSELFNRIVYTFIVAFIPLFPLILVGFRGARLPAFFTFFVVLVLVCTFSPLLTGISLFNWDRWMWLLVFPFGMYAFIGVNKVIDKLSSLNIGSVGKRIFKALFISAVIFLFASLSFVYITRPQSNPFILYGNFPSMWYLPETMQKTALPFKYIPDLEDCAKWLDNNVLGNSVVLFESPLTGPVLLNLTPRNDVTLVSYYPIEFAQVLQELAQRGFDFMYLFWFTEYALPASRTDFTRIYSKGALSVYVKPEHVKPPSFVEKTKLIRFNNETYVEIPDNERLSPPTFTVEFWAKPLSFTPGLDGWEKAYSLRITKRDGRFFTVTPLLIQAFFWRCGAKTTSKEKADLFQSCWMNGCTSLSSSTVQTWFHTGTDS